MSHIFHAADGQNRRKLKTSKLLLLIAVLPSQTRSLQLFCSAHDYAMLSKLTVIRLQNLKKHKRAESSLCIPLHRSFEFGPENHSWLEERNFISRPDKIGSHGSTFRTRRITVSIVAHIQSTRCFANYTRLSLFLTYDIPKLLRDIYRSVGYLFRTFPDTLLRY